MSGIDFFDSNVLVYSLDPRDERKRSIAAAILSQALVTQNAVISFQVVQECLSVIGRRFGDQFDARKQDKLLDEMLIPLMKILPSAVLYRDALRIKDRYGFSFYDALVVASALQGNCKRLLSEDLQHGRVVEGLKMVNPFL